MATFTDWMRLGEARMTPLATLALGAGMALLAPESADAAHAATGERGVSGVRITLGEEGREWTLVPTLLDGKVESFLVLREGAPMGENLTAVWYRKVAAADGTESWESRAFTDQDQSKAVRAVKEALSLADSTDESWPVAVAEVAAAGPKRLVKGVLETDALAPLVAELADPEPIVEMLEDAGWKTAWVGPLEAVAPGLDPSTVEPETGGCPQAVVLAALASGVEASAVAGLGFTMAVEVLRDCAPDLCTAWTIDERQLNRIHPEVRVIESPHDLREFWEALSGHAPESDELGIRLLADSTVIGYERVGETVATRVLGTLHVESVLGAQSHMGMTFAEDPTLRGERITSLIIGTLQDGSSQPIAVHALIEESRVWDESDPWITDSLTALIPRIYGDSVHAVLGEIESQSTAPGAGNGAGAAAVGPWCRDERGFCNAALLCAQRYELDKKVAMFYRALCYEEVHRNYVQCMGACLNPDGSLVFGTQCALRHTGCSILEGAQTKACDLSYLYLVVTIDSAYGRCINEAKRKYSRLIPHREFTAGCGCPPGFVPFPQQFPPRWGDINCAPEFTAPGAPGWPYPIFIE